ncbi:unnamed protein product [Orchesella dallaii]|uniref:C-type lectin domain-containing protein n=1 Tax=Orchesella dallaii TaxID=48710 RepID=A0ABP1PSI9_9HEXA
MLKLLNVANAHVEENVEPFDWGKNQTVSLKGLFLGKTVAASSFLGKPNSHGETSEHNQDSETDEENQSPSISGRVLSSSEGKEGIPLSVLLDEDAELYPPELIAKANELPLGLGRSIQINSDTSTESPRQVWLAAQASKLFGASLLTSKSQDSGISSEDDIVPAKKLDGTKILNKSSGKSSLQFNTEDDQDDSAEDNEDNASGSENNSNGLLTASRLPPKENEEVMQGGRSIPTADETPNPIKVDGDQDNKSEANDEEISGRFQEVMEGPNDEETSGRFPEIIEEQPILKNSDKWKSDKNLPPENKENSSERGRNFHKKSGKTSGKFPAHLKIIEMSQTDELFDCSDRRGTLVPISDNSKYLADVKLTYNYEQAKKLCMDHDLVLAELMDVPDHWSIQGFVSSFGNNVFFNADSEKFFIGPNDIHHEGVYRRSDNGKNISFQNYHTSQPDDRNMAEDCTTVSRESKVSLKHIATQIFEMEKNASVHLLVNASERAYFVSSFQLSWSSAMDYCINRNMTLYNLDEVTNLGLFRSMIRWESKILRGIPIPPVQYWTSGKFKKSHMNAEIYWYRKPYLTDSEERVLPKVANFTFSGLFRWSSKKKKDAGAPYTWRRDLCLSFAFEGAPDPTPFVRNTNCDLPAYFVCVEVYDDDGVPPD